MKLKALSIYAGPRALDHVRRHGLTPQCVRMIPAAAGGPKGIILTHLDRFLFADWLPRSSHQIDLVGASIGAWRMAAGMTPDPRSTFDLFASGYAEEHYEPPAGKKLPTPAQISDGMRSNLDGMFGDHLPALLNHQRFKLHVLTSRGRGVLHRAGKARSALGFSALALSNAVSRKAVGAFLERVVFSSAGAKLPVPLSDLPTRHAQLNARNFNDVVQASCSIPFMFRTIENIQDAPRGTFWDGGIIDYHLHWNYNALNSGLVLYPHFQKLVIPGWLDKPLKWRRGHRAHLSNVLLLAPNPHWVANHLPGGKLPDRKDLTQMRPADRSIAWRCAISAAEQLADEFALWVDKGAPVDLVEPL